MIFSDIILLPLALWSAIALRYGTFEPAVTPYFWLFIILPVFTIPVLVNLGLYRAVIRYVGEKVLRTVFYGVSLSVLFLIICIVMLGIQGFPRSSILIYWVLSYAYISASRFIARGILRGLGRTQDEKVKVAIYGSGQAGIQTALALMSGQEYQPVLFFDDNPDLHGSVVAGIRVYNPKKIFEMMDRHSVDQLLLALPSASRYRRQEIIRLFEGKNIQLKTIPGMGELLTGRVRIDDIREVGIEDLLGRDPVPPFEDLIFSCIQRKSVLVTGAGGSIGSELCRQILNYQPSKLVLFERSEHALYELQRELNNNFKHIQIIPILGDVQNEQQLKFVLSANQVETVYHAAAYKHVPLVESNIIAGVTNNVFGTLSAARAAMKADVETFVLISTDKAVRPTSIMGVTKRLAEIILQAISNQNPKTRFCMVRFGNVLGSSGSVVPLFRDQIRSGGPVTVTHPDVTRFMMTATEAAQLVIQAGAMGTGGEVFVLDMGESIKINDLACKMIELSGFTVKNPITGVGDIAIEYVGLRPGEKLYEELLIGSNVAPTRHTRIMKANEQFIDMDSLSVILKKLNEHCDSGQQADVLSILQSTINEFKR